MLKLNVPDKAFLDRYAVARTTVFKNVANDPGFDPNRETGLAWAEHFVAHLRSNLKKLLIGEPAELRKQVGDINKHAQFSQFAQYCAVRPRGKKRRPDMEALIAIVGRLFDYENLCNAGDCGAYALIQTHDQRVCPYCQMHHVNYHMAVTKKDLKLRPPLDHFYPRRKYPYLATSLFNLVPSCEQCNSRVKLARDPLIKGVEHPFESAQPLVFESGWRSRMPARQISSVTQFSFSFAGKTAEAKKIVEFFKLEPRYQWYDLELLDLVKKFCTYQDLSKDFRDTIGAVDYMLNFPAAEAERRALGVLLADVSRSIVAHA